MQESADEPRHNTTSRDITSLIRRIGAIVVIAKALGGFDKIVSITAHCTMHSVEVRLGWALITGRIHGSRDP